MATFAELTGRVGLLAGFLARTLQSVAVMHALAALGFLLGAGLAGDWSRESLVLGGCFGAAFVVVAVIVLRFVADLNRIRELPQISGEEVKAAAGQLATTARTGERRFMEAKGARKLVRLAQGLRGLKADVDALADGGLAPAVSLSRALRPLRLVIVTLAAVAAPFVLVLSVIVFSVGLAFG